MRLLKAIGIGFMVTIAVVSASLAVTSFVFVYTWPTMLCVFGAATLWTYWVEL